MAKIKATPTPWKFFTSQGTTAIHVAGSRVPVVNWAGFDDADRPKAEHAANARLIVKAVNCHADLLAALESFVRMDAKDDEITAAEWSAAVVMGRAAIAKAAAP